MERCPEGDDLSVAEIASQMAQGAFFGARGNSGVILSQFFQGFSDAFQEKDTFSGHDLAHAFDLATKAAYGSVGEPVEGTMLTVIRQTAEAVQKRIGQSDNPEVARIWETAFNASREALIQTPNLLPVLRESGVGDSGGLGMVVIIGGGLEALDPQADMTSLAEAYLGLIDGATSISTKEGYLDTTVETGWGYCTEFIISAEGLDLLAVRDWFQETYLSTVVVGDDHHVRVHIHAEDPGPAMSYAVSLGSVSNIKIENMDEQNSEFAAANDEGGTSPHAEMAVLAVVSGKGLAELFRNSGCAAVLDGGQTMNPSVEQILGAAKEARAHRVIVLPNNRNIVATAQQAAASNEALQVVPTTNIPQGVAALLSFNPDQPLENNQRAINAALAHVSSIAVTKAVRETTIGDMTVAAGDFIGLLEDNLVATGESAEEALNATLALAGMNANAIITIYRGSDADYEAAERLAQSLEAKIPGIQVDRVDGGQPHYHYFASLE